MHTHSGILLSHQEWNTLLQSVIPFAATWMGLEMIIPSKVSHKEKDKYHTIPYHLYVKSKIWYKWTYLWNKTRWLPRRGGERRVEREFGISRCKLLQYKEWINSQAPLYGTGNYIQYRVINNDGKEHEKECTDANDWVTVLLYGSN